MSENAPLKKRWSRKRPKNLPLCKLQEIREVQKKSIRQLAEESGVHRNLIANIEMGAQEGIASNHLKLIKALGVSADEYFGLISPKSSPEDTPDIVDSRRGCTVELFPTAEGTVKRIQLAPNESVSLKRYLDSQRPVFFYVTQGQIRFQRNQEFYEQGAGAGLSFPRASNIALKNVSSLSGVLLAFQR